MRERQPGRFSVDKIQDPSEFPGVSIQDLVNDDNKRRKTRNSDPYYPSEQPYEKSLETVLEEAKAEFAANPIRVGRPRNKPVTSSS